MKKSSMTMLALLFLPVLAHAQFDFFPTQERISARIAELNPPEKGLPEDLLGLNDERQSLAMEIANYRNYLGDQSSLPNDIAALEKSKSSVLGAINGLKQAPCSVENEELVRQLDRAANAINNAMVFNSLDELDNPWVDAPTGRLEVTTPSARCERWKSFISQKGRSESLVGFFDVVRDSLVSQSKREAEARRLVTTVLELLEKRKVALSDRLSKLSAKDAIADNFWIAIAVIGTFSLGAIFIVKLFSPEIQVEWVASGQVIQFVTVMILLSVIMALGLAGILKENTLGTLLGGIAGYVLAQGVGRAAAREASRGK